MYYSQTVGVCVVICVSVPFFDYRTCFCKFRFVSFCLFVFCWVGGVGGGAVAQLTESREKL